MVGLAIGVEAHAVAPHGGMVRARHDGIGFLVEVLDADRGVLSPEEAERQVEVAMGQGIQRGSADEGADAEGQPRRRLAQAADERRCQHGAGIVRRADAHGTLLRSGVEAPGGIQDLAGECQHGPHVRFHREGTLGGFEAVRATQEEFVAEQFAQPGQRVRNRRLGQTQPLGDDRGLTVDQQFGEHEEQVEVEPPDLDVVHFGPAPARVPPCSCLAPGRRRRNGGGDWRGPVAVIRRGRSGGTAQETRISLSPCRGLRGRAP